MQDDRHEGHMAKGYAIMAALLMLAACGGGDRGLRDLRSNSGGPDEFSVLPVAPLEMPANLSSLPAPTPGGRNLVDPTPKADAIAALGGRPSAVNAGGIPASDGALVAAAGRNGVPAGIRATVGAEDAAFRRRAGNFGIFNILGRDRYFPAYRGQKLDAYAELERLRGLGVETPTAPPAP